MIDKLLEEQYNKDNYLSKILDPNKKICYLFFSSNGLYHRNDEQDFTDKIVVNDYYEWTNIAQSPLIKKTAGKIIFVRDIYMHFYVDGINSRINDIDKLCDLLKNETQNYEITAVGTSAGAYMAFIAGMKLCAKRVLCFGGVFALYNWEVDNKYPFEAWQFYQKYIDDERSRYFYLPDIANEYQINFPAFNFYASESLPDVRQDNLMNDKKYYFGFGFKGKIHGKSMLSFDMPYIIAMDNEKILKLHKKYKGKKINKLTFSFKSIGVINTLKCFVYKIIRKIKRYFKKEKK